MGKIFLIAAGIALFASTAFAASTQVPAGKSLPPSLLDDCARTTTPPNDSPFNLRADGDLAAIHLVTESPFTPYLGITRKMEPEEEGSPSVYRDSEKDNLRLELGIGCLLGDNASLNVGYRLADPTSALMDPSSAALETEADDLHISFDLTLPF
ncbi:MAG: hypothetical protein R2940_01690 [Syntrophotaleaceae bacterium]